MYFLVFRNGCVECCISVAALSERVTFVGSADLVLHLTRIESILTFRL
jgi:hypothetical protein